MTNFGMKIFVHILFAFIGASVLISNVVMAGDILDPGINYCKQAGNPCNISVEDTNGSTEEGIASCKQAGNPCNISVADTNGSTEEGIASCKQPGNPCNIFVADTNGSKQEGDRKSVV